MKIRIPLDIYPQPDETTCGPTCLYALYHYFNERLVLEEVISEIEMLEGGGTLAVMLACHALRSGYKATLYTYNLMLFDPTWFELSRNEIRERLREQGHYKHDRKFQVATRAYLEFLELGGELRLEDLNTNLIANYLKRSIPVLAGLSSTYLYGSARVSGQTDQHDDIRGEPCGHFVVLCGYDKESNNVLIADPYLPNVTNEAHLYEVPMERLICAILLGVLTYDGNLLIIEPRK